VQLIEDWRKAWKMASVRIAVVIIILNAALALLPQLGLSPTAYAILNSALGTLVAIARVVRQPGLHTDTTTEDRQQ
jgi:hypothetical protein